MPEYDPLPYDERFQTKAIAAMVQDPKFLVEYSDILLPNFFDATTSHYILTGLILKYFNEYQSVPTREVIGSMIVDYAARTTATEEQMESLHDLNAIVFTAKVSKQSHYLLGQLVKFARYQRMKAAAWQIVHLVEQSVDNNFERARSILDEALRAGEPDEGGLLGSKVLARLPEVLQDSFLSPEVCVPTGILELDGILKGGTGPGELCIVAGPTGIGKSGVLANFACSAIEHFRGRELRKTVYVFTNELSEAQWLLRIGACLAKMDMDSIVEANPQYSERIDGMVSEDAEVVVKFYPQFGSTASTYRSFIQRAMSRGIPPPGLIICDYPDLMDSASYKGDSMYLRAGHIYGELRQLLGEFQVPGWVASQVNRGGYGEVEPSAQYMADSMKKSHDTDLLLSLSQSDGEKQEGFIRIYTTKVRRAEDKSCFVCRYDKSSMLLEQASTQDIIRHTRLREEELMNKKRWKRAKKISHVD